MPSKIPTETSLIIYYWGNGKGKTTAALGVALRASGTEQTVLILQAIKSHPATGEILAIKKLLSPHITIKILGEGFVGIQGDTKSISQHRAAAKEAICQAQKAITQKKWWLIILDEYADLPELNRHHNQDLEGLIKAARKQGIHLIITGHRRRASIEKLADIVTEMRKVKHIFDKGVSAQRGIDF